MIRAKPTPPSYLGKGAYSIAEAARLLREPSGKVRRWVQEYAIVKRAFGPDSDKLSFLELMELYFVSSFRGEGVSMQTIRKTAQAAASKFGTSYPFAVRRFDTDGKTIFATLLSHASDKEVIEDLEKGQYVFDSVLKPFFRKLEYSRSEEAMRFWPLGREGRVVLDVERRFGSPIDNESGVPTNSLYLAVQAGDDMATVAQWFDVPLQAVKDAVAFEESLDS